MPDNGMLKVKAKKQQDWDLLSYCKESMRASSCGTSVNSSIKATRWSYATNFQGNDGKYIFEPVSSISI